MLSLETMGYFSDTTESQKYPFPISLLYPNQGNFIGFVGNLNSGDLVRKSIASFCQHAYFPSEGVALPEWVPGVVVRPMVLLAARLHRHHGDRHR